MFSLVMWYLPASKPATTAIEGGREGGGVLTKLPGSLPKFTAGRARGRGEGDSWQGKGPG